MKKIVAVSLLSVFVLAACQEKEAPKTSVPDSKPAVTEKKEVSTEKKTETEVVQEKASFYSYQGEYTNDDSGTSFTLHFVDGKDANKAFVSLSAVYDNGSRIVDGGKYLVDFDDNGTTSFHYSNSREGEGTAKIVLHDGKATVTFTHQKDSFDGYDFYEGSKDFDKYSDAPQLNPTYQKIIKDDYKDILKRADIPTNTKYPINENPDAVVVINPEEILFAWIVPFGQDGQKDQIYFYVNDKFIGTDTKYPIEHIVNLSLGYQGENSISAYYVADAEEYLNDAGIFVEYDYKNGKIEPINNDGYLQLEKKLEK